MLNKGNVICNYIYSIAYQGLLLLMPLFMAPYLSRVLGPDGVGTASYVESISAYFVMFATMGITIYGQREISYVQNDTKKRSMVFWNIKILEFCSSTVAILAYVVFSLLQGDISTLYLILTLNIVGVFFDITWFFQGMEEFGKIVTRNAAIKLLQMAYIFLFINTKEDLPLYVLGVGLFTTLGNLSLWAYLPKYVKILSLRCLHPFRDIKEIWSLFIPTLAIQIYTVLDKTMIGVITGSSYENGYYEQSIKISKLLLALVTSLVTVMTPRVGSHFAKNEMNDVRRLMYCSYRFVWFLSIPLCLGLIMTAGSFVPWFLGPGYDKVVPLLGILSFLIPIIGLSSVTGRQYLVPTKRQNFLTISVLVGACINFILNLFLIPRGGAIGAAIASVIAESAVTSTQLWMVRSELHINRIMREGLHYYIAGMVMVLILWPVSRHLTPSILHTVMLAACGAVIYFLMLLIERDEFFLTNVRIILRKLRVRL